MSTTTRIDLPGDAWIELTSPKSVKERKRRPITRLAGKLNSTGIAAALKADDSSAVTEEQLDIMSELNDAVAVALIKVWSFEEPVSVDALQDALTGEQYDKVREETSKHFLELLPNFEPSKDTESPSTPSQP